MQIKVTEINSLCFFDSQASREFGGAKVSGNEIGALNVLQMLDYIADHTANLISQKNKEQEKLIVRLKFTLFKYIV